MEVEFPLYIMVTTFNGLVNKMYSFESKAMAKREMDIVNNDPDDSYGAEVYSLQFPNGSMIQTDFEVK
jgi:hypothetical protein